MTYFFEKVCVTKQCSNVVLVQLAVSRILGSRGHNVHRPQDMSIRSRAISFCNSRERFGSRLGGGCPAPITTPPPTPQHKAPLQRLRFRRGPLQPASCSRIAARSWKWASQSSGLTLVRARSWPCALSPNTRIKGTCVDGLLLARCFWRLRRVR